MLYVPYRTTTVMQITEYNLLSQSTNVYPLAPKDQCVRFCIQIYAFVSVCDTRTHIQNTHTHNTNIHMYECVTEMR